MMKYYYLNKPVEIVGFEARYLGGKYFGKYKNKGRHGVHGMYIRFIDGCGDGRSRKRWIRLDYDKFEFKEES